METLLALLAGALQGDTLKEIVGGVVLVVGGFAIFARFTPNKTDDRVLQMILDGINFLGMNHGNAKNAPDA